eukprot:CAMPEP_0118939914 /NCGR_PEP_ID=MMETSP1169-20130426/30171_1 /TAXON_ID=36882 /ORGANISM="Pyramimonas obovata, Strain CCMP722" /LENGTH=143 /DNA_ID=CAMNT_0006884285 /DNA_START=455 /DNA_END=883 /DNA_ORIENTATION=+
MAPDQLKYYIQSFRIKELKDVLGRLGLPRAGKKQDLTERLLIVFNEIPSRGANRLSHPINISKAARIVEEVYQSTRAGGYRDEYKLVADAGQQSPAQTSYSGAGSSASRAPTYPMSNHNGAIRCPCKDNRDSGLMIQCESPSC